MVTRGEGGIDISEVKELIKVSDRADKKRERERVKEKHKTRRLKSKVKHQSKQKSTSVTLDQVPEESTMPSSPAEAEESLDEDTDYLEDDEQMALHLLSQQ